jgi:hypothetical protein
LYETKYGVWVTSDSVRKVRSFVKIGQMVLRRKEGQTDS